MAKKNGRHTPAFLLLFLAQAPSYGAMLLKKLQEELPYCFSDSAIVYRSLKDMEKNGLLKVSWETTDTGQPRKWYAITPQGRRVLEEYAQEISQRQANFEFFLSRYKNVIKDREEPKNE